MIAATIQERPRHINVETTMTSNDIVTRARAAQPAAKRMLSQETGPRLAGAYTTCGPAELPTGARLRDSQSPVTPGSSVAEVMFGGGGMDFPRRRSR
jgi:hypothetical protein